MMFDDVYVLGTITTLAKNVIAAYAERKLRIVTTESCTGGLIAGALTSVAGSSAVFERGFVTYSNAAKAEALAVRGETLEAYGAVSALVAEEMAQGALAFSHAHIALSVTGIAGPGGGTPDKPVGLVYFGLASRNGSVFHYRCNFQGDRDAIRAQAVIEGLKLLQTALAE